ncbi:MAG TPA: ATP-binding protein [Clostridia bacterium]|nr:ATP-binding protein [Clostridia bacterium]
MSKCYSLGLRLRGMVIFRKLLEDEVLLNLTQLLELDSPNDGISRYALFAAALYEKGDNLSDYILSMVLRDENLYMLRVAQKKPISAMIQECMEQELLLLEEISRLSPQMLREALGYDGFLPSYYCSEHDFMAAYAERAAQISRYGYGVFAGNRAFIIENHTLAPVRNPDPVTLDRLPGYQRERQLVVNNTLALIEGRPAANVLLYGDSGTGKSSTVKAIVNEYAHRGLRLIELKKNQLTEISALLDRLSTNPLSFILFIDDLSFTKDDDNFAALKAILEGSISYKNDNVVVYATSNRRHLVKENFSDREGDEIHLGDTIAELTSLSDRFGLTVTFERPGKRQYLEIVLRLAQINGITQSEEALIAHAETFALRRAGRSPRVAKQFIESLLADQT